MTENIQCQDFITFPGGVDDLSDNDGIDVVAQKKPNPSCNANTANKFSDYLRDIHSAIFNIENISTVNDGDVTANVFNIEPHINRAYQWVIDELKKIPIVKLDDKSILEYSRHDDLNVVVEDQMCCYEYMMAMCGNCKSTKECADVFTYQKKALVKYRNIIIRYMSIRKMLFTKLPELVAARVKLYNTVLGELFKHAEIPNSEHAAYLKKLSDIQKLLPGVDKITAILVRHSVCLGNLTNHFIANERNISMTTACIRNTKSISIEVQNDQMSKTLESIKNTANHLKNDSKSIEIDVGDFIHWDELLKLSQRLYDAQLML